MFVIAFNRYWWVKDQTIATKDSWEASSAFWRIGKPPWFAIPIVWNIILSYIELSKQWVSQLMPRSKLLCLELLPIKINNANNQDHRCRFIFDTHDHINFFGFCSLSNILQKSKSHFNRTGPSLTPQYIMVENLTDRDDRPPEIGYVFLFKTLHLTWAVTTRNDTKDA